MEDKFETIERMAMECLENDLIALKLTAINGDLKLPESVAESILKGEQDWSDVRDRYTQIIANLIDGVKYALTDREDIND